MNYYNPYFYMPMSNGAQNIGLISRLLGGRSITFAGILNGTQKILNVTNQAIPLVKQAKPVIGNIKTVFKVMNEFKRNDKNKLDNNINSSQSVQNDGPTFFQ